MSAVVSESKSYERYGLGGTDRIGVKAWTDKELKRDFEVGREASSFQHTFVKIAGAERVFHALENFIGRFDQTLDSLRDKTVLKFKPSEVLSIEVRDAQKTVTFERRQAPVDVSVSQESKSPPAGREVVWESYQAGEIHLDRGDIDRAAEYFRQSLAIDPKVAPAYVALGVVAFTRGDVATADQEIHKSLEIKPDVRLAHYNLGIIAEARGDVDAAMAAYRREIELHEDAYKAVFNAARLLQQRGDTAAALPMLERAVAINARFAEGHLYLAQARLAGGNVDGAVAAARTGLELAPASATAPLGHFVLALAAMHAGRLPS